MRVDLAKQGDTSHKPGGGLAGLLGKQKPSLPSPDLTVKKGAFYNK